MVTYETTVKRAVLSQATLINKGEHCSADEDKLATIGCALGQQIRVKRTDDEFALYTISEFRQERPERVVRMGREGRARLFPVAAELPNEFAAIVDLNSPQPPASAIGNGLQMQLPLFLYAVSDSKSREISV